MGNEKRFHSICRWTFHAGKGGFLPANVRPSWSAEKFGTPEMIRLVKEEVCSKLPSHIQCGIELHYDNEVNEDSEETVSAALLESDLSLAMITPGAHGHYAYGGVGSLDRAERESAQSFGSRTVDLAYGALRQSWHADVPPTFVVWNGSFGYDLATPDLRTMYRELRESLYKLYQYESTKGGELFFGLEPKPNEGHPQMFLPTVASAIVMIQSLQKEKGEALDRLGVNMEIGHSEMIGLDHVHDVIEQLETGTMTHFHLNSQGYNDGLIYGGPAKFDIDHGVRINGMNIAIAALLLDAKYSRWLGHDMQPRSYDNEAQACDRVVRSILSWDACEHAAAQLDREKLTAFLAARETAKAEDLMRASVMEANQYFADLYT